MAALRPCQGKTTGLSSITKTGLLIGVEGAWPILVRRAKSSRRSEIVDSKDPLVSKRTTKSWQTSLMFGNLPSDQSRRPRKRAQMLPTHLLYLAFYSPTR